MKHKTIVLANGAFPKAQYLLDLLDGAEQIICCDGAVNKLVDSGREPSVIIGDLDSVRPQIKAKYADLLIHISDQITNDLTKAINWCCDQNISEVILLGATGEREDHTIANIGLLNHYSQKIQIKMCTELGQFLPITGTTTIESFKSQQVSLFSQDPQLKISSEGLKYSLNDLKLESWWMGTLNESLGSEFTIELKKEGQLVVYLLNA